MHLYNSNTKFTWNEQALLVDSMNETLGLDKLISRNIIIIISSECTFTSMVSIILICCDI